MSFDESLKYAARVANRLMSAGIKAALNANCFSMIRWWNDGKKLFLDTNAVFIGKTLFVSTWLHDKDRADRNVLRETDLKQGAIDLDKWSKTNARHAKAPFSWKTLTEIMSHLYPLLGVNKSYFY